jgi:dipeptidyl-peptidase-4
MKKTILLLTIVLSVILNFTSKAQTEITVEDLYLKGSFRVNYVYGISSMNDGVSYTSLNPTRNAIIKYSYTTGETIETIFATKEFPEEKSDWIFDYEFNADETKMLISVQYEPIYRHSFKAEYFIYDINKKTLNKLSENGKQQLASFSPDGTKIAFVRDNNIFVKDIVNNSNEIQLTEDGKWNKILNGAPDWVYEEEFSYNKAYSWSPDSKKIAFLKSNESEVKMFSFPVYGELYPKNYDFKYPKAGEDNSKVSLHIVDVETKLIVDADMGDLNDVYIPRLNFTKEDNVLAAVKMNRLQNLYELYFIDAETGNSKIVLTLKDPKYIEINDDLTFFDDKQHFILSHETNGFRHLYLYDINGKQVNQITSGSWEVTNLYGVDEVNKLIYFQGARTSPLNREVYSVGFDGNNLNLLTNREGTNDADFSNGFKYFINNFSDANTPPYITLNDRKGVMIRELETNERLVKKMKEEYKFSQKELFSFTTENGVELNGWMIKPPKFKSNKKHPVFMYVYGGPGNQTVTNSWDGNMGWWQLLAQKGYIIVSVDNRGTGARGKDFRQVTYEQLGKYEVIDQIDAAKYLGSQKYVDKDRIGIFGWSYGGYMSTLCMTIGADFFKLGIAVAPVTNWRYYDSVYTERYNGLPKDNAKGYDENSPIHHVNKMKGRYLLIHGTADDNVHFQNTVGLVDKLIEANVQFETMFYPNKDHSIYGGNSRFHLYTKMTNFVLNNL